jgi:2-keto-4-pentenoate hydratase/2-oxohepta-3-ene-1,7-dioic acid hydratase in catechol pathway
MDIDIDTYIPGKIICVGMNYKSHIDEQDGRFPTRPVLFSKAVSSIIKDGQSILYPPQVKELDYEVELAVIIGKKATKVNKQEVFDYVYGYTIINDVTARDIQRDQGQWYQGKSYDTFAPIGPAIIAKDEIEDPQNLNLRSYVNKELRQNSNTSEMIFDIATLISYITQAITLMPGDLVATGTPAGVGVFMTEKKLLQPGDEVICEIENIGRLANKVMRADDSNC